MTDGLWNGMRVDAPPPEPEPAAESTPKPDPEDAAIRDVLREIDRGPAPEPVPEPDRFCPLSFSGKYPRHCGQERCALWGRYAVGRHDVREPTMFKYIQFVTREGCTLGRQVME